MGGVDAVAHSCLAPLVKMPLDEWKWFEKGQPKNKVHYWALHHGCVKAIEQGDAEPGTTLNSIRCAGTKEAMRTHLRRCQFVEPDAKDFLFPQGSKRQSSSSSLVDDLNAPVAKRSKTQIQATFELAKKDVPFNRKQQDEFERQSLFAALDANLAFQWTDSEEVAKMFRMCKPGVEMPRRKVVSGRILSQENQACYERGLDSLRLHGRHGVALSMDAWKNIKKQSLLGSLASVIGLDGNAYYLLKGMQDVTKYTHDAVFMKDRLIQDIKSLKAEGITVKAIILDGAGECRKARRIIREDPDYSWLILIWCNAHLFNLLFNDLFHTTNAPVSWPRETIDLLVKCINYFNNHRVALGLLWERQKSDPNLRKVVALWNPGSTRWNSYGDSAKAVLISKDSIRDTVTKDRLKLMDIPRTLEQKKELRQLIDKVEVTYFWNNLESVIDMMEPLMICVDRMQSSFSTMGSTLLCLLYCFSVFKSKNDIMGNYMMACLEKRWNELDKSIYIVAYALDPRLCFSGISIDVFSVSKFIDDSFTRLFQKPGTSLLVEFASYFKMNKERQQFMEMPYLFWDFAETKMPELASLAILLMSLSPQGAELERVFSASGIFHNALRNRLSQLKAEQMVRIKMDMLHNNPRRARGSALKTLKVIREQESEDAVVDALLNDTEIEAENDSEEIEETVIHSSEDESGIESDEAADIEQGAQITELTLEGLFCANFDYEGMFSRFHSRKPD